MARPARMTKAMHLAEIERRRLRNELEMVHVRANKCPECGAKLERNLSLHGWWQCSQFGDIGFRADDTLAACNWQTFVE